jgi:hypothetical protein
MPDGVPRRPAIAAVGAANGPVRLAPRRITGRPQARLAQAGTGCRAHAGRRGPRECNRSPAKASSRTRDGDTS